MKITPWLLSFSLAWWMIVGVFLGRRLKLGYCITAVLVAGVGHYLMGRYVFLH